MAFVLEEIYFISFNILTLDMRLNYDYVIIENYIDHQVFINIFFKHFENYLIGFVELFENHSIKLSVEPLTQI
mgnify:CR=1 FL=1